MPVDTNFFNDEFLDPVKASQGQDGQNNAGGGGDWYMGYCIYEFVFKILKFFYAAKLSELSKLCVQYATPYTENMFRLFISA